MNESIALSRGWGIANAGEALALPGAKTAESTARDVPVSAEGMIRALYDGIENLIFAAIGRKSSSDFQAIRAEIYPTYYNAALAFPSLARVVLPPHVMERINREFFCELEADLRQYGLRCFGEPVRDQAIFTAWMLRKIADLATQIPKVGPPELDKERMATLSILAEDFQRCAIWTRFHLHCLVTSMRSRKPIFPEPLELILDGLRSAVNTYALIRRALDILNPQIQKNAEPIAWDDEDEALLAEANNDMIPEVV
jgi:hypothetical protein